MATLITSIEAIKEYVSVNRSLEWDTVKPYVKQAERKYVLPIIGSITYDLFSSEETLEGFSEKVYELLREASANLAWFLYLPLANVQVTDSGISVAEGEHYKAAQWWQIRDLRRSFIDAGFTAIDEALRIMEENESSFSDWKGSEGYTVFKELFVKRTDTFNRWFHISNSRKTFLALRPYMLESYHQFFLGRLSAETIAEINFTSKPLPTLSLELGATPQYRVLDLFQAAMVNYTVYKAIHSGTFELTSNGIYEKIEEFPGYKSKPLEEEQLRRIKNERLVAAEEYYKKAIKIIESNPESFTNYQAKETAQFVKPKNTGSIVSF